MTDCNISLNYLKVFFILYPLLGICSCLAAGDAIFSVKGSVFDINDLPIKNCTINLYSADDNELIASKDVAGNIDRTFSIEPSIRKYYMTISCSGYHSIYRTDVYELGGRKYFFEPIDIGKIVIR